MHVKTNDITFINLLSSAAYIRFHICFITKPISYRILPENKLYVSPKKTAQMTIKYVQVRAE